MWTVISACANGWISKVRSRQCIAMIFREISVEFCASSLLHYTVPTRFSNAF
jgi:hypothetical protein